MTPDDKSMVNILTIDVEDWYQVYYANELIPSTHWPHTEERIIRFLDVLQELLSEKKIRATLFAVGQLVERHPRLFRELQQTGHEIASHSYSHQPLNELTSKEVQSELERSKKVIEDAIGTEVLGFRAPGYTIDRNSKYILEMLKAVGYKYDSSLLWGPRGFYQLPSGLYQVAPNSIQMFSKFIPVNGGFFFRLLPYDVFRLYFQSLNRRGSFLNFYTHTWELDDDYPRLKLPWLKRFVQYHNLPMVKAKFGRLIGDFKFTSIEEKFGSQLHA